jgi:hypothetical protein
MRTKGHKCYNIKCGACGGKTLCGLSGDEALTCVDREVASDVIMRPMTDTSDEPSQIQKLATRYERNMHKPWKKPMTNADRIRAMSDKELAEWLSICGCPDAFSTVDDCENGKCEECWSTWLQQPYISEDIKRSEYIEKDIEEDA